MMKKIPTLFKRQFEYYRVVKILPDVIEFTQEGAPREMFKTMIREIVTLAEAMGIHFEQDLVEVNLQILSDLSPEATTSMQRDIMAGKPSEIDGLIYQVVRLGQQYGVPLPQYEKVTEKWTRNKP